MTSGEIVGMSVVESLVQALAGIVLGAKVPVILTSRADPPRSRMASCAIALMLAHHYRTSPP